MPRYRIGRGAAKRNLKQSQLLMQHCRPRSNHRAAISMVELLIVIAIIGVLVSLLLPAIQSARQASRRTMCLNNLRQLALAMLHYESAAEHLPAGSIAQSDPANPTTPHTFYRWSAFAQILPQLESSAVLAQLDLSLPMYRKDFSTSAENRDALKQTIPLLLCPADRQERVQPDFGPTNYAACSGSGNEGGSPLEADGVFYINSNLRLTEITDGTSQTVFLAECLLGQTLDSSTAREAIDPRFAYVFATAAPLKQSACDSATLFNFTDPPGFSWANGEFRSALFNHYRPPNSVEFDCVSAKLIAPITERYAAFGWRSARSLHGNGVNAALVDGSARFFEDNIHPRVWRAMSTRQGAEIPSEF